MPEALAMRKAESTARHDGLSPSRLPFSWHNAAARAIQLPLALLLFVNSAQAWGGKVKLVRKWRPGQQWTYQTTTHSRAVVRCDPPALTALLPPLPKEIITRHRDAVTVRKVNPDGSAELECRFDNFEIETDVFDRLPEKARALARQDLQEISQHMAGRSIHARFDQNGELQDFNMPEGMLDPLDVSLREPLRQILRLYLEQLGGNLILPEHRIQPGESWKGTSATAPSASFPFSSAGERSLRYVGRAPYHRAKAVEIEYHSTNVLSPTSEIAAQSGWPAMLKLGQLKLDIGNTGR
jgi:hypothetical protein